MAPFRTLALALVAELADRIGLTAAVSGELAGLRQQRTGDEQGEGLGVEAPSGEHERLGGRPVEPVRIVDAAQRRAALGDLRQQAKAAQRDEEPIRDLAEGQPERGPERTRLRCRQAFGEAETGPDELMQGGKRGLRSFEWIARARSRIRVAPERPPL